MPSKKSFICETCSNLIEGPVFMIKKGSIVATSRDRNGNALYYHFRSVSSKKKDKKSEYYYHETCFRQIAGDDY